MMKRLLIATVLLVVLGAGLYFTGMLDSVLGTGASSTEDAGPPPRVAIYQSLDPPFVANFTHRGALRFLQISVDAMFYEQSRIDLLNARMPAVRNDVILLLRSKDYESLSTTDAKELLRKEMLEVVARNLDLDYEALLANEEGGIYITNFIMQ